MTICNCCIMGMLAVLLCFLLCAHAQSTEGAGWTFYIQQGRARMVAVAVDAGHNFQECYSVGNQFAIDEALKNTPTTTVVHKNSSEMNALVDWCTNQTFSHPLARPPQPPFFKNFINPGDIPTKLKTMAPKQILSSLQLNGFLIFPGTKYCGDGNISSSWDDLGPFRDTDACCRAHDSCPDYITAGDTNHGLHNDAQFTKSLYDCDMEFYSCLEKVDSIPSNTVGVIFFDIVQMICFRYYYPVVGCTFSTGLGPFKRCQKYEFDMIGKKIWEFLDDPLYFDQAELANLVKATSGSYSLPDFVVRAYFVLRQVSGM